MTVQLPNARLGVQRVEASDVDAHGSPLPAAPGQLSALLPAKVTELNSGAWQLAVDPSLWPVRVGDHITDGANRTWVATVVQKIDTPPLSPEELALGLDLDVSFVRVTGSEVTEIGTEPTDPTLVGRSGSPI